MNCAARHVNNRADLINSLEAECPDVIWPITPCPISTAYLRSPSPRRCVRKFLFSLFPCYARRDCHRYAETTRYRLCAETAPGPVGTDGQAETRQRAERKNAQDQLPKKARELTVLNGDLEQFAYAASHDRQEPLRTISVFSKLLATKYKNVIDAQMNTSDISNRLPVT
jgi:hypothetical protein